MGAPGPLHVFYGGARGGAAPQSGLLRSTRERQARRRSCDRGARWIDLSAVRPTRAAPPRLRVGAVCACVFYRGEKGTLSDVRAIDCARGSAAGPRCAARVLEVSEATISLYFWFSQDENYSPPR